MSGLGGINFSLPDINGTDFSKEKEIKELKNYMALLTKQLQFTLNNLDPEDNFTEEANQKWESVVTDDYVTSAIEQSADHILLSISKEYATNGKVESVVRQTSESILLAVKNNYAGKEYVSEMKAQIEMDVNGIRSTVSKKVGNDEIISKINQSAENITISANKINLKGTTFADYIKINGGDICEIKPGHITLGELNKGSTMSTLINLDSEEGVTVQGGRLTYDGGYMSVGKTVTRIQGPGMVVERTGNNYPKYRTLYLEDGPLTQKKKSASANWEDVA